MKRVLLSAYTCSPYSGTEPGNGWNWAKHLSERGMDVHVVSEFNSRKDVERYQREHPDFPVTFSYLQTGAKWFRKFSGVRYAMWQFKIVAIAKVLHKAKPFDIVHHVTFGSIHVPSQLWRLKIPVVFGPVGGGQTAPTCMLEYFGGMRRKERLRTLITRALPYSPFHRHWMRKLGIVLATNLETMDVCRRLGRPDARLYFDTGLPESFFAQEARVFAPSEEPLRLLWVGRLLPRKAMPLTLDILAQTKTKATLTIIGNGMEESLLRGMIRERGLVDRVFWNPERVPWEEVRDAYSKYDALLFTSLRDSCGAQLLESMARGLPVITLDIHGGRDLVPDAAGFKVPVENKQQVIHDTARAIDQYAAMSPEARSEMSAAALRSARNCTWTLRAAFAESLYAELLHRQSTLASAR